MKIKFTPKLLPVIVGPVRGDKFKLDFSDAQAHRSQVSKKAKGVWARFAKRHPKKS